MRGGQRGERGQRGGAVEDRARERPDVGGQAVPGVRRDGFLQARQVAGRVVDADAHADEVVGHPVDRGVKAADQLAGRARLLGAADDVERHAVDVRQQPPEAAARRASVGRPSRAGSEARRDQARRREPLGHRDDVAVHLGREDPVHRLQDRAPAVAAGQEVAAVDEAGADARDRGAVPPVEVGQDVRADLATSSMAASPTTSSPPA